MCIRDSNSIAPVKLNHEVEQERPEGTFRVSREGDYSALQLSVKGAWSSLYKWRDEPAAYCDQEAANWYSCTFPAARFTTSFFGCRVVGDERHHILNGDYVVRKGYGVESTVTTTKASPPRARSRSTSPCLHHHRPRVETPRRSRPRARPSPLKIHASRRHPSTP